MGLLDVSRVTETLVRLLQAHVASSPAWPSAATLDVTPEPPDLLAGDNTLGLYLYRMEEDPTYKNLPPNGAGQAPVRYTPMGLNLYYLLTAHSDSTGAAGTYREQLIMGCAVKALHDYAVIDDAVQIAGATVMHPSLVGADNRFRISLVPVDPDATASYFAAGGSNVRLAMHYLASVVLLEPEEPPGRPGRVLSYGVHTFTRKQPHLTGSSSTVVFTVPGATGQSEINATPAQPAPGETLTLTGSSLTGDSVALLLRGSDWSQPVEAGPAWNVQAAVGRDEAVTATVQETIGGRDVVPGLYTSAVRVTTQRTMPGGGTRDFDHTSNETPFFIVPRLDGVTPPDGVGVFTVTGYLFQHPDLALGDVRVYIADQRLAGGAAGTLDEGEFAITGPNTIEVRLVSGLAPGDDIPVRVLVRGAESAPRWVVAP